MLRGSCFSQNRSTGSIINTWHLNAASRIDFLHPLYPFFSFANHSHSYATSKIQLPPKTGRKLVSRAVDRMVEIGCQEVALEAEVTNAGALHLYERQGFAREERLFKYYLNGVDAFRLKLWLAAGEEERKGEGEGEGGYNRIHQHSHGEQHCFLE